MKVLEGSPSFPASAAAPVVALGNFDGVHLGHQMLIRRAREEAARRGGTAVVYTFEPHPVCILSPSLCPPLLCRLPQKLALLEQLGVDMAVVEPFTAAFSQISAEAFFEEIILRRLHAATLVAGSDFTFGHRREGTVATFATLGRERGVDVVVVPPVFVGETLVSSTVIREMIREGDVEGASTLLGRPYALAGEVVRGRGVGRDLAARTANMASAGMLIPADGVYFTTTRLVDASAEEAEAQPSITSVGHNPTFRDGSFAIETHLIDADVDLVGKTIAVDFLARLRDQVRFPSEEALREEIARDIALARAFHRRRGQTTR